MVEGKVFDVKNPGYASVKRRPLPERVRDEAGVRARQKDLPVDNESVRHVDSLNRTAVYVTRTYGGVGGGVP